MRNEEFLGRVWHQARLSNRGDAVRACQATLETLGEWIPEGLAGAIAAQLPPEIGGYLRPPEPGEGASTGERLGNASLVRRIAGRAGVGDDQAASIARAVLDALTAATEGGLMARVTDTLPADLREYVTPPPGQESWERDSGWTGPVVGRGDSWGRRLRSENILPNGPGPMFALACRAYGTTPVWTSSPHPSR
jgi:uncharacterized protein (DUF2267 family)